MQRNTRPSPIQIPQSEQSTASKHLTTAQTNLNTATNIPGTPVTDIVDEQDEAAKEAERALSTLSKQPALVILELDDQSKG
jgi:hypothetical protein